MLGQLTDPNNLPFSVALAVMLLLALVQIAGLGDMLGGDADADADIDIDADASGHMAIDAGLLSLIGIGRVPFLMWLMLLLTAFGLIGMAGQQVLHSITGGTLNVWIASALALVAALPVTGLLARPLAAILPRDETSAVTLDSLVGREAEIVIGTAMRANAARARVHDVHGLAHYVMVEPDADEQKFVEGERILLVRREGDIFNAIARGDHYLPRPG
jgi:hypothetical protein